jgi:hypothetical protein
VSSRTSEAIWQNSAVIGGLAGGVVAAAVWLAFKWNIGVLLPVGVIGGVLIANNLVSKASGGKTHEEAQ